MLTAVEVPDKGNRSKLDEMEQKLKKGLDKFEIRGVELLPQKIQETKEQISKYEKEGRTDDIEKETTILKELQWLQNLAEEIAMLSQESSTSHDDVHLKLSQMKEELRNGLAKFRIRDETMLLEKIQRTEVRIKEYEDEGRAEDVEKETVFLKELQQLKNLANEIARLSQEPLTPHDDVHLKLSQMKEELRNGLAKFRIRDETMLLEKIQRTEVRIKEYEDEGRAEDVEKETVFLKKLQWLQNLAEEIATLSQELSTPKQEDQSKIRQMEEELSNGFAKLKIRDEIMLAQRIQKTKERIKDYEEEERTNDVEREKNILKELQRLQNLANQIARLSQESSHDDSQFKLRCMKEELGNGFTKQKIRDEAMLSQRIQKTQERIKEYQEEERIDDVEKSF